MLFKALGISGFPENGLCFLIQGEWEKKVKITHKKDLGSNPKRMGNLQWFLSAKLKRTA